MYSLVLMCAWIAHWPHIRKGMGSIPEYVPVQHAFHPDGWMDGWTDEYFLVFLLCFKMDLLCCVFCVRCADAGESSLDCHISYKPIKKYIFFILFNFVSVSFNMSFNQYFMF